MIDLYLFEIKCAEEIGDFRLADALDKKWMRESGISYVIPYKKRGKKVIKNWDEALQAAINMSKDLS